MDDSPSTKTLTSFWDPNGHPVPDSTCTIRSGELCSPLQHKRWPSACATRPPAVHPHSGHKMLWRALLYAAGRAEHSLADAPANGINTISTLYRQNPTKVVISRRRTEVERPQGFPPRTILPCNVRLATAVGDRRVVPPRASRLLRYAPPAPRSTDQRPGPRATSQEAP